MGVFLMIFILNNIRPFYMRNKQSLPNPESAISSTRKDALRFLIKDDVLHRIFVALEHYLHLV
jgi:hypothetical protein